MKLQVKIGKCWHYVFCRNKTLKSPVLTDKRSKAIKFNKDSLNYFSKHFGSLEFRGV